MNKTIKRKSRKIGSNDASDADDARFMGVKLFVTCVICVILKFKRTPLKDVDKFG